MITAQNGGPVVPIGWGELWVHYTFDLLVQTQNQFPLSTQLFSWTNGVAQIIPPAGGALITFPIQLTNFHNDFTPNGTDTVFTTPETSVVIMCSMQVAMGIAPVANFVATVSLQINGLALISQFITIYATPNANNNQTAVFQYPVVCPLGTTISIFLQNPSATGSVSVLPGSMLNFLCV